MQQRQEPVALPGFRVIAMISKIASAHLRDGRSMLWLLRAVQTIGILFINVIHDDVLETHSPLEGILVNTDIGQTDCPIIHPDHCLVIPKGHDGRKRGVKCTLIHLPLWSGRQHDRFSFSRDFLETG
jgi:hypothetical protein